MDQADTLNTSREDLMRAPNRKRKTPEECRKPRVIKMMWDVDTETTNAMMNEVGVSFLVNDEENEVVKEEERRPKPTPPTTLSSELVAPGAPRAAPSIVLQSNHSFTATDVAVMKTLRDLSPITPYVNSQTMDEEHIPSTVVHHEEINGADGWNSLSDEVMLSVFNWLPKSVLVRCARVNHRWNRIALDESLWRRLDLSNKCLKRGVIGRILDRGVAVLRLAKSEILMPLYIMNPMFARPRACRLQYLDLSMATVTTQCLEQLLSICCLLSKLSLENCQLNDTICRYIGQNKKITSLNLCMCQGLTENSLVPICNNLTRLEELNVAWTNMSRGAVVYLVICLPARLNKLNLSGNRECLTDEDVQQLCNSCPHLKELDLSDSTNLTSQSMTHIISGLSQLEYLALSRCYQILPSALAGLANVQSLLAFDVFGMLKDAALDWLRETLTNVAHINQYPFSSIARPTTGIHRTSIWGQRVHDSAV